MKRIILFFTVCLGLSVYQTAFADDADVARSATKRTQSTAVSTNTPQNRSLTPSTKRTESSSQQKNIRTATQQQRVVTRTPAISKTVKSRATAKQTQAVQNVAPRISTTSRNATTNRTVNTRKTSNPSRSAMPGINRKNKSRAAELNTEKINAIKSADFSKCKTVYYECMDEFCANKDSNLRRCACSGRIHEFDSIKKQLSDVEDKMLDFNQSLLTVNLDKEDATAINVATAGELAYATKDRSDSEKLLQKITKTLNGSGDSKINNNLSAISLSLDMDTAWDNIDSLGGVATTSKNGLDLYNAARPICIEMAKEVCSDNELSIVQDGYKLTIQQDCDTVAKSYKTLYNSAMEKIHESGALLDMSRLNIYQQRNSDDALTCKKKILEQLSDNSVCGEKLHKCLDITGQYINPSNGEAFLSTNLADLTSLIQEPVSGEKWSEIDQNEPFVNMLKSKKKFLEPAIEQCQDIADTIWKEFLDDALSQIKLAQNAKLEEIRQSCTTLIAECKNEAMTNLSDFDARSLSTFNVIADVTVNEMCSNFTNTCNNLMANAGIDDWEIGMSGLASDVTLDKITETCAQIGRDCIIQHCNGTGGNFALCKNETAQNRIDILQGTCKTDVRSCVAQSKWTTNKIDEITNQIWGTECTNGTTVINQDDSTLLSWFATNTGSNSCNKTSCPDGYVMSGGRCRQQIDANGVCGVPENITTITRNNIIYVTNTIYNYCAGAQDGYGNCCSGVGVVKNDICVPDDTYNALLLATTKCTGEESYYCPSHDSANPREISVYCITTDESIAYAVDNNGDTTFTCGNNGFWVLVDQYGNYFNFKADSPGPGVNQIQNPKMTYLAKNCGNDTTQCCDNANQCEYIYDNSNSTTTWSFGSCNDGLESVPTDNNAFTITYGN